MRLPASLDLPRFPSLAAAIAAIQPHEPVYCLLPDKFETAANRFLKNFPGDALYAVKSDPEPKVMGLIWALGAAPKLASSAAKIFVRVFSCACTSRPITHSYLS